jgi:hypothetical protein
LLSMGGPLGPIANLRDVVSGRVSSWDRTGRNDDCWIVQPGESVSIADLPGPGLITHIWMTQWSYKVLGPTWEVPEPDLLRTLVLRATWDDDAQPAILVPLGDFFCLGNGVATSFASLPFTASVNPHMDRRQTGHVSLNCYLPMPFASRAHLEVLNEGPSPVGLYFHVDFELHPDPPAVDVGRLHAAWRREAHPAGWGPDIEANSPAAQMTPNLSWEDNYRILDVRGDGQFIGCNLTVVHMRGERRGLRPGQESWWGEGDDMIVIDGEPWPPRLHGTGSEDYFGHAWEMQAVAYPMTGSVIHERDVPDLQVSYRFHLTDPIRFRSSILVSMERGHANHLADDWSSTAYWYARLPSPPASLAPVAERLPIRMGPQPELADLAPPSLAGLTPAQAAARSSATEHLGQVVAERDVRLERMAHETRAAERAARAEAQEMRDRHLGGSQR